MGGKVFSSGDDSLHTPRMAPAVYEHVKKQCISALRGLFPRVESPIEAPEKVSFGDIDILVSLEGTTFSMEALADPSVWTLIQEALGGVRSRFEGNMNLIAAKNIAIPWPTDLSADECAAQTLVEVGQSVTASTSDAHAQETHETGDTEDNLKTYYIQVDVCLCANNEELDWRLFKHNHGDLWNMLGQTIRPFGLTADETGLYIRISEIERENRKGCRVFLTNRPIEVLDFLGLSHQQGEWERPFESVEALFEYAASCRWFMLWLKGTEAEEKEEQQTHGSTRVNNTKGINGDHSEYARRLKHNDRARMKQRPVFARWVEEFRPRCREQGRFLVSDPDRTTPAQVRDEVRLQAFRAFPDSEPAHAATLAAWRREKARICVKRVIKENACLPADVGHVLPAPQEGSAASDVERSWRGVLRSALAKILIEDDEGFAGVVPPKLRDDDGILVIEDIKDWIVRNWEEVGRVAWSLQCARASVAMEERKRKLAEATGATDGDGAASDNNGA